MFVAWCGCTVKRNVLCKQQTGANGSKQASGATKTARKRPSTLLPFGWKSDGELSVFHGTARHANATGCGHPWPRFITSSVELILANECARRPRHLHLRGTSYPLLSLLLLNFTFSAVGLGGAPFLSLCITDQLLFIRFDNSLLSLPSSRQLHSLSFIDTYTPVHPRTPPAHPTST